VGLERVSGSNAHHRPPSPVSSAVTSNRWLESSGAGAFSFIVSTASSTDTSSASNSSSSNSKGDSASAVAASSASDSVTAAPPESDAASSSSGVLARRFGLGRVVGDIGDVGAIRIVRVRILGFVVSELIVSGFVVDGCRFRSLRRGVLLLGQIVKRERIEVVG